MTLDIMMPFYGRDDHFRAAVRSVLAQDDKDWRLIVLDDANPDPRSGEWLVGLSHPQVTYVRHAKNQGINANFQEAIDRASSDRLVIFGCDDIMLPRFVARVHELIRWHPDAAMIHPGTRVVDVDGRAVTTLVDSVKAFYRPKFSGTTVLSGEKFATSITRGNWMNFPAIAWRREAVSEIGFRTGWNIVQDLALGLDVAFAGGSLVLDDEVVFEYRRHSESVSSWQAIDGSRFVEERLFFKEVEQEFTLREWTRASRAAKLHLSSRMNALSRLPTAVLARDLRGVRKLVRHVVC